MSLSPFMISACVDELFRCAEACFEWDDHTEGALAQACAGLCLETAFGMSRLPALAQARSLAACADACEKAARALPVGEEAAGFAEALGECAARCRAALAQPLAA